jgi:hypothetical protein
LLQDLGIVAREQGQLEKALQLLLNAAVGLELTGSPDLPGVLAMLGQLRAQVGEVAFPTAVERAATGAPEPAYGHDPVAWAKTIERMREHRALS